MKFYDEIKKFEIKLYSTNAQSDGLITTTFLRLWNYRDDIL